VACWFTRTQAQEASAAPRLASQEREPPNQPKNIVWIPGGEFWMGGPSKSQSLQAANDVRPGLTVCRGLVEGFSDAEPHVRVHVDGFWIDKTVVTNEEFAKFAEATGYITVAERQPTAEQFPAAPPVNLVAGSACFTPPNHPISLDNYLEWWSYIPGANWSHPNGPESDIKGKEKFPVVHVAYADAEAYALQKQQRRVKIEPNDKIRRCNRGLEAGYVVVAFRTCPPEYPASRHSPRPIRTKRPRRADLSRLSLGTSQEPQLLNRDRKDSES
jgi:formylglycine-generating enzyme required for sulfatase activity